VRGVGVVYKQLGRVLKGARERSRLTREDATMLLGLSNRNFLCNCENGKTNFPAKLLPRACELYELSSAAIIEAIITDEIASLTKFFKKIK
jgi:hypothetical protein